MEVAIRVTLVGKEERSICHLSIKNPPLCWPTSLGSSWKSDVLSEPAGGTNYDRFITYLPNTADGTPGLATTSAPLTAASLLHRNSASAPISIGIVVPDKKPKLSTTESLVMFFKTAPMLFAIYFKCRRN